MVIERGHNCLQRGGKISIEVDNELSMNDKVIVRLLQVSREHLYAWLSVNVDIADCFQ